jgi:chemotaxis protein CheX
VQVDASGFRYMKVEYINPFLSATISVIETMAMTKVTPGKPGLKSGNKSWGSVTGIIGMASDKLRGNAIVSFEEKAILGIVSRMLSEDFTSVSQDVLDAVGEITNMIVGNAKRDFSEKGYVFDMAIPLMVVGKDLEMSQMGKGPTVSVPFGTEFGNFVVEINFLEGTS